MDIFAYRAGMGVNQLNDLIFELLQPTLPERRSDMSKSNTFETEQLTDAAYYIMLSLLTERHGYAIMQYIEQLTDGEIKIGPATLYTLLKKMKDAGLIEQLEGTTERKKDYQLTATGLDLIRKEVRRRERMARDGQKVLQAYEGRNT